MESNPIKNKADFTPIKKMFAELVDEKTFEKECSFALQHLQKNAYLSRSTPNSILVSVLNLAQIGLTLNPAQKLAYLVPRYNSASSAIECCLEPSYQGLIKLLTDSGSIVNCYAHLVYENDEFEQNLGTENIIIHKPKLGVRGKMIGVYAVAVLANGSKQTEVMDIKEVEGIRDTSESYKSFKGGKAKSCIWDDWFDEMARKTVIKRIVKYLPKSNFDKLAKAIDLTNDDFQATFEQLNYIDGLLHTSTISEEKKEFIEKHMSTYNKEQAQGAIEMLKDSQVDSLTGKGVGGQTEIKEALKFIK